MNLEAGKCYRITYASESGETSERYIDVIGMSQAYGDRLYIRAYCHLRGEARSFRAERIIHAALQAGAHGSYAASSIP